MLLNLRNLLNYYMVNYYKIWKPNKFCFLVSLFLLILILRIFTKDISLTD